MIKPAASQGLSSAEAASRLKTFGPNELPNAERRNFARIAFEVARQPMFALLLGGGVVYLLLGEAIDAVVLLIFATLSVSISIVQETRSERVLEALRNLASPRALVLRDGERKRIPGREVVPGDIVILSEGDRVPADAFLVDGHDLLADESLLTGESVPVRKRPAAEEIPAAPPGGDDLPFIFAGTLIARGSGTARVIATGLKSEMGKIGRSLQSITLEQPRLQAQLGWLVRDFAFFGIAVAGLAVILFGILRGSWLKAALGGVAIGMSMMPEEIPLVLAVFMAMGAWRISRALQTPASPYELLAGTIISASLITGLNSDLPGTVIAQVTENCYDSATGATLLVPQGSRLIGVYDSVIAFGQSRALLVWQRIIHERTCCWYWRTVRNGTLLAWISTPKGKIRPANYPSGASRDANPDGNSSSTRFWQNSLQLSEWCTHTSHAG